MLKVHLFFYSVYLTVQTLKAYNKSLSKCILYLLFFLYFIV